MSSSSAHASSCTVAVVGPCGKRLQSQVLETIARALVNFLKTIPKPRHLCLEEGTHAGWLYEVLAPHVQEIVVAGVGGQRSRGAKDDQRDAFGLAEGLRIGAIETRIKSLYRSRGIPTGHKEVYAPAARAAGLQKLPANVQALAAILYEELDAVRALQKRAAKELLAEARQHRIFRVLRTCPSLGTIRTSQLLPIVVTPYRFASKRGFWAYAGMAIVMRSSADWARATDGSWVRVPVQQTRGLNRNYNHTLKQILKGAATTVIQRAREEEPSVKASVLSGAPPGALRTGPAGALRLSPAWQGDRPALAAARTHG